jgi:phospholipid/cholesterol/gamma-HCH transport system permease protein
VFERIGTRSAVALGRWLFAIGHFIRVTLRGLMPGNWRRTMREEFASALFQIGVRAVPAVVIAALLVGVGLVLQLIYWLAFAGQEARIGEFIVITLVRELAPVGTALIIIGRSGAVLVDEVGQMRRSGQLALLESFGIDPVDYIQIPRAFACAVAAFLLTVVFLHVALWSAYLVASVSGVTKLTAVEMVNGVLGLMTFQDHLLLLVKPLLIGYVIGFVSIGFGLHVDPGVQGIRRALPKAFVAALIATFAIGALVSVLL